MVETRKRKYVEEEDSAQVSPATASGTTKVRQVKKPKRDIRASLPTPPPDDRPGSDCDATLVPLPLATVKKPVRRPKAPTKPKTNPVPVPGLATPSPEPTPPPTVLKRGRKWEIFFGREMRSSALGVTDELLASFLEEELSARFPAGSTYTGATGQWRRTLDDGSSVVVREGTTVVFLVEFEGDDGLGKVQRFRELVGETARAYKARFNQDAVLVCEIECFMDFI